MRSWGHEVMNHLTHPEAPAIGGFGKVPRESACCAAVHIATKLKLQSECFIFFLHVFPPWKIPWKFRDLHGFPIIFHHFPWFSHGKSHGKSHLSHLQDAQPRRGAQLRLSLSSPGRFAENLELSKSGSLGTLARPGDGKMGCWRYSVYIYIEIDRFS